MEQATKTPWPISIPWLPGKHNALVSPKTIHSGGFMVEMSYVSGGTVLEAILGSFEHKKASLQKGGFSHLTNHYLSRNTQCSRSACCASASGDDACSGGCLRKSGDSECSCC